MRTLVVVILLLTSSAHADDWPTAHPQGWYAPGFGMVAEMFPPKTRHNPTAKPVVYVYEVTHAPGWVVSAKLKWKGALANRAAPYEALVTTDGWLITFDEWASLGFDHAIAIYDAKGKLVASKKLDDLVPADVANRERSVSSRQWRRDASYALDPRAKQLQITLAGGEVVHVQLANGKHAFYAKGKAPKLRSSTAVAVWPLDLRFSSVTDVLAAKPARP